MTSLAPLDSRTGHLPADAPASQVPPSGRSTHPPRPWVADSCAALAGIGFGAALGAVITGESRGSLAAPGGWLIAGGRLAGFTGAYLMLLLVLLIARLPWLEQAVGQDHLVR